MFEAGGNRQLVWAIVNIEVASLYGVSSSVRDILCIPSMVSDI